MDETAVVVDTGSSTMKVGFAGEHSPRLIFMSVIGRPRNTSMQVDAEHHRDIYVGSEAEAKRGVLSLHHPMRKRTVCNWDDMELIWTHALHDKLGMTGSGGAALLTVGPQSERSMRERMLHYFFENVGMDKVHLSVQPVLALYATGRSTGLVVDSGLDITHIVPVHKGNVLKSEVQRLDVGGFGVTKALAQQLEAAVSGTVPLEIIREVKEKLAYVALDFDSEKTAVQRGQLESSLYELPDGSQIEVSADQRFECSELLFHPDYGPGLADLVRCSTASFLPDLQAYMMANVVMAGGNTLLPNIERRLQRDLQVLTPQVVRVEAPSNRGYSAWLGGSVLASLNSFRSQWITRAEFEEHGGAILDRKCI